MQRKWLEGLNEVETSEENDTCCHCLSTSEVLYHRLSLLSVTRDITFNMNVLITVYHRVKRISHTFLAFDS